MTRPLISKILVTAAAWSIALLLFLPIFWMILTSFKTEVEAISSVPHLFFKPTFENYVAIEQRASYLHFALNSVIVSFGSTLLALLFAVPAAYAMSFFPTRRTKDVLLWMLSTKMMPAAGVLVPIYLITRNLGLLDTRAALLVVNALINLPILVWMLYTFFKEIPRDILEAGRMDGAGPLGEIYHILLPLALPGIISTSLLAIILSWNEAFWSLNLTAATAAPLTAYIASFSSPEGLFWGKLSAASTLAVAPIMVLGWLTQKQLVRGLTFGAVK